MTFGELMAGSGGILILLFLALLALLWFFLPFAIFGIKDYLQVLINENRATNAHLKVIATELAQARTERLEEASRPL